MVKQLLRKPPFVLPESWRIIVYLFVGMGLGQIITSLLGEP